MCVGENRVVVMVVCGGGSVGVLISLYGGHWVWGWVCWGGGGWVFGSVGGWMSEFWTSDIVYMLILTISMSKVC